jgi:hypothetical protein
VNLQNVKCKKDDRVYYAAEANFNLLDLLDGEGGRRGEGFCTQSNN